LSIGTERLLASYPKIFFACHLEHVRDPETETVLTAKQASILDHLDLEETVSLNGLAKHMGVTPATMCVAVDRLEELGYMTRTRSLEDRRTVVLRLTPAGLKLREAHSVLDVDRVQGMLAMMSPEERERGLAGLELLAEAANRFLEKRGSGWSKNYEIKSD
jgi:MarR family transcriptional regulator, organic hydroperoxide resistance regulator